MQVQVLAVSLNPKGSGTGDTPVTWKRKSQRDGYLEGNNDLSWDKAKPQGRNQRNKYSGLNFLTVFDLPFSTLAALNLKPEITDAHWYNPYR